MFCTMRQTAAAQLLEEIERSGSGSAAFWELFWGLFGQLAGDELRRVLTAAGHRSLLLGRQPHAEESKDRTDEG